MFLCEKYEEKDWCRLEWRAVRDIIKRKGEHVMFFRFDEVTIPDLFSIDGYISPRKDPPEEAARHTFNRLQIESCLPETVVGHPVEGTAIDSGNWLLLDKHFFRFRSANTTQSGDVVVEIETLSSEEESIIEELRPKRFAHDVVPLAYRNDAIFGRISGIQSRSGADVCLYTATLNPKQLDYGGNFMEMGTRGLTANQFAELRARRILLNDPLTLKNETAMDTMIEVLVRGTQMPISVTESPIPRLYRECRQGRINFCPVRV